MRGLLITTQKRDCDLHAAIRDKRVQRRCIFPRLPHRWMERDRNAAGEQVPNSTRFPSGWPPVCDFAHSLGMKCGLYTSKSQYTCAGFNASCEKEVIDAATYASWGVDYIKCVGGFGWRGRGMG